MSALPGLAKGLFVLDAEEWRPIPPWASACIQLGQEIRSASREQPLTCAVALPTRSFATALLAAGVVAASPNVSRDGNRQHFENLRRLPSGTPVTFVSGDKLHEALFVEARRLPEVDEMLIKIQLTSRVVGKTSAEAHWVGEPNAHKIQISENTERALPEKKKHGKQMGKGQDFLEVLLPDVDHEQNITMLECVLIGSTAVLATELKAQVFAAFPNQDEGAAGSSHPPTTGSLQDICRAKPLLSEGLAYRCDIKSSQGKEDPSPDDDADSSPIAIFDGALAYDKWGAYWASHSRIIVLDRTETQFESARLAYNTEFLDRAEDGSGFAVRGMAPGIEVSMFEKALRATHGS